MDKSNINKHIASTIRIERLKKGFSQEYVAMRLNISQKAYSRIERGRTKLDVERLYDIASLLDVDMGIFFPTCSKSQDAV